MNISLLKRAKQLPALICWSLFAAGLLVKSAAPGLKISNGAFVIPPTMVDKDNSVQPDLIVAKERLMTLTSMLLTVTGALGLAFCHRGLLLPGLARSAINPPGVPLCGTSGHSQQQQT